MDDLNLSDERQQQLNRAVEAIHFGFRAFVAKPDAMLAELGLARTHHRILYFVGRYPAGSVNDLLRILGVSKQFLNRPLKELIERGLVQAEADGVDRRVKRLSLTAAGTKLEGRLTGSQRVRLQRVFTEAGAEKEQVWREVMAMIADPRFDDVSRSG